MAQWQRRLLFTLPAQLAGRCLPAALVRNAPQPAHLLAVSLAATPLLAHGCTTFAVQKPSKPIAAAGDTPGGAWREPDALSDSGASDATMAGPPGACADPSPHAAAPACDLHSDSDGSCSDVCMDSFAACPLPEGSPALNLNLNAAPPEAGDEAPSSEVSEAAHERGEAPQCEVSEVDAVLAQYSVTPLAGPAAVADFALARIRELVRS